MGFTGFTSLYALNSVLIKMGNLWLAVFVGQSVGLTGISQQQIIIWTEIHFPTGIHSIQRMYHTS